MLVLLLKFILKAIKKPKMHFNYNCVEENDFFLLYIVFHIFHSVWQHAPARVSFLKTYPDKYSLV